MTITPPRKILIAEDDADQLRLIAFGARQLGYEVIEAIDGNQALEIMTRENPPRIAVLDWNMPGITGPDLCAHIRGMNALHYTYIILLTVRTDMDDLEAGLAAGADDYLIKPSHPTELLARINVGRRVVDDSDELVQAMSELTNANEMLRTFTRTLAHDIRGSLATIDSYVYLLNKERELSPAAREYTDCISQANHRIATLVSDVLALESAARLPERTTIDLREVLSEASADSPNVDIILEHEPDNLRAHRSSLTHSFRNLVENASRYALRPDRERVTVYVDTQEDENEWTLIVEDDGPGIPSEDRQRIFESFERGSNVRNTHGTGLGLSIVAACARAHAGSVMVTNGSRGGARFVLTLAKPDVAAHQ